MGLTISWQCGLEEEEVLKKRSLQKFCKIRHCKLFGSYIHAYLYLTIGKYNNNRNRKGFDFLCEWKFKFLREALKKLLHDIAAPCTECLFICHWQVFWFTPLQLKSVFYKIGAKNRSCTCTLLLLTFMQLRFYSLQKMN